jgi:acetylornithine deacetylase
MALDVIELTKELSAIESVSRNSNAAAADRLDAELRARGFTTERLEYTDAAGVLKVNIVGRKGEGTGGIAFLSHLDTVPGTAWTTDAWSPRIEGDRLVGLGVCDMKGPLAATIVAAAAFDAAQLKRSIVIVGSADEEVGLFGARQVAQESALLKEAAPAHGVVAEPTSLVPVHAHKGGAFVRVTAHGRAAHTSQDTGISANFLIAPFLAEMAALAQRLKEDTSYHSPEFSPPTLGFNLTLTDYNTAGNITAAKTTATLGMRPAPNDRSADIVAEIEERARHYGFEVQSGFFAPFSTSPDAAIIRASLAATGLDRSEVVPYGTEAGIYQGLMDVVILGPGDIAQAHTDGEWIELAQLHRAVEVYTDLIAQLCM